MVWIERIFSSPGRFKISLRDQEHILGALGLLNAVTNLSGKTKMRELMFPSISAGHVLVLAPHGKVEIKRTEVPFFC